MLPLIQSKVYYPDDPDHLWDLLRPDHQGDESKILLVALLSSAVENLDVIDRQLELLEVCLVKDPTALGALVWDDLSNGPLGEGPASFYVEDVANLVKTDRNIELLEPSSGLRCDKAPILFSSARISEFAETDANDFEALLEGLFSGTPDSDAEVIVLLFPDRLRAQIDDAVPRALAARPPESSIRTVIAIECPVWLSGTVRLRDVYQHWRVQVWSEREPPSWEPYDQIRHFLKYGWGNEFEIRQRAIAARLGELIAPLDQNPDGVSEIHDVGCGQGEILSELKIRLDEKKVKEVSYNGYDPAKRMVTKADMATPDNVTIHNKGLIEVSCESRKGSVVLMLGNTLAHIGAKEFRQWLTKPEICHPEYLFIDFAAQWQELLDQANPEVVCGPVQPIPDSPFGLIYVHMTTAGGPGWVKRGVVLNRPHVVGKDATNSLSSTEQRLFTRQFADHPEAYYKILGARGYSRIGGIEQIESGWGRHDLVLFRKLKPRATFEWPKAPTDGFELNDIWYEFLKNTWRSLPTKKRRQLGSNPSEAFPAAVLPFGKKRVYARYIPRNVEEEDVWQYRDIFKAWMWVVDPATADLTHQGAAKQEKELPYAPSINRAVMGRVPGPTAEHFDVKAAEYRIDENSSDMELADLERKWMAVPKGQQTSTVYYTVPIFVWGIPAYVVMVRSQEVDGDLAEAHAYLRRSRKDFLKDLNNCNALSKEVQLDLLSQMSNVLDGSGTTLQEVLKDRIEDQTWTSWLDVAPGAALHRNHDATIGQMAELKHVIGDNLGIDPPSQPVIFVEPGGVLDMSEYKVTFKDEVHAVNVGDHGTINLNINTSDYATLAADLENMINRMKADQATSSLLEGAAEAKKGAEIHDESMILKGLKTAGMAILEFAKDVGTSVTVQIIKDAFGIPA